MVFRFLLLNGPLRFSISEMKIDAIILRFLTFYIFWLVDWLDSNCKLLDKSWAYYDKNTSFIIINTSTPSSSNKVATRQVIHTFIETFLLFPPYRTINNIKCITVSQITIIGNCTSCRHWYAYPDCIMIVN